MKLYLERYGRNFGRLEYLDSGVADSDMTNHRLHMEFIDREGKRSSGEVSHREVREFYTTRAGNRRFRVLSENGLDFHRQYENHKGCWRQDIDVPQDARFMQSDVLRIVNSISAVQYEAVEIVDKLPPEAHDYPPEVLALEQQYLAKERAAEVAEARGWFADGWRWWLEDPERSASRWSQHLTPDDICTLTRDVCTVVFDYILARGEKFVQFYRERLLALYRWLFTKQHYFSLTDHPDFLRLLYETFPEYAAPYVPTLDADTVTL